MKIVHHLTRNRFVAVGTTLLMGLCGTSMMAQTSLTPGQFAVNDAGAATYSIPLTVASGAGGFSPKLTLQYSSQAPNGVFGVGWTLSGVSSITRCAKTPAEDGERVGIKNNATDLFCLDGQKLRAVSGVYGAPGTQYRTAIDTYGRITSQGNVSGGPQFFTLETKSGEIYTFGGAASPGSWLEHPSKGVVRTWMVSEIKDRFNNRISFTYSKDVALGEQLLTQLDYSNGRLQFAYEARPANDQILKYDDGVQYGSTNSRVGTITVAHMPMVGSTPTPSTFKVYQLQYSQSQASQRSMLRSVRECAPDGSCLPAISLTYRDGNPGVFSEGPTHPYLASTSLTLRRYGIKDTLGSGKQSIHQFSGAIDPNPDQVLRNPQVLWDIDGDMRTDYLFYESNCVGEEIGCGSEKVIKYGNGITTRQPLTAVPLPMIACYADLDGNGTSEEVSIYTRFEGGSNSGRDYYYVKNPFGVTPYKAGFDETLGACKPIDIDGDGRSELFFNGNTILGSVNGSWVKLLVSSANLMAGAPGDFNGDGKTDGAQYFSSATTGARKIYLSTGSTASPVQVWSTSTGGLACMGDFNGDGRTDALVGANKLDLSNGRAKTTVSQNAVPTAFLVIACGDFNGDGLMDVAVQGRYWYNALPADVDRLIEVNNGTGFVQRVEYKSITDSGVYDKGAGATYPQIDMQTPIMVVHRVQSGNESQGWQTSSYRYAALRADLKRSGTQGFERVTSTNENTGVSVATHYYQAYPLTGLHARVHKFFGSESAPQTLEDSTFGYLQRGIGTASPTPQMAQVHLNLKEIHQFDLGAPGLKVGSVKEITEGFDSYGFPARVRVERYDAVGGLISISSAEHAYNHQDANWLLGQLIQTKTASQNLRSLPTTVAPSTALTVNLNPSLVQATLTSPGAWSSTVSSFVSGGLGAYNYSWTNPSGSRVSIENATSPNPTLVANLGWNEVVSERIRLTVSDSIGNSVSKDLDVALTTPPAAVSPISTQINPSNIQYMSGSAGVVSRVATATASGGFGALSFLWTKTSGTRVTISNATATAPTFSANLGWGESVDESYQLKVTDVVGTTATQSFSVKLSVPNALSASLSPSGNMMLSCGGYQLKAISASGGVPPYTYLWTTSQAYFPISAPTASQTYISGPGSQYSSATISVRVTDSAGNQVSTSFLVQDDGCF